MAAALHWLFKLVTIRGYVAKSDTFIGAWILGKAQNPFSDNIGHYLIGTTSYAKPRSTHVRTLC